MALCFLIGIYSPRASAITNTIYNPSDYIEGTYYEGTDKYVTIKLPIAKELLYYIYQSDGKYIKSGSSDSISLVVNNGDGYYINWLFYYLNIADFPDSTKLDFDISITMFCDYVDATFLDGFTITPLVTFYNESLQSLSSLQTYPTNSVNINGITHVSTALFKKSNLCSVGCRIDGFNTDQVPLGTEFLVEFTSLKLSFSVSALIDFMDRQDRTNNILNHLLYADPEVLSMIEAYRDKANGLGHKVDGMSGALAPGSIGNLSTSDVNIFSQFNGFTPITGVMSVFLQNNTLTVMLTITAMCAVIGFLFFGKKG